MTHLETIRAACIKANPKIKQIVWPDGGISLSREIRLADVLLAMQKVHCDGAVMIDLNGQFWNCDSDVKVFKEVGPYPCWNLLKDDVLLQTPETQEFIAKLLS